MGYKRSTSALIGIMPIETGIRTVMGTFSLQKQRALLRPELVDITKKEYALYKI